jgi:hypothetical protein
MIVTIDRVVSAILALIVVTNAMLIKTKISFAQNLMISLNMWVVHAQIQETVHQENIVMELFVYGA